MRNSRLRVLVIICLPLIASGILSTAIINSYGTTQLKSQSEQFGQTISDHVAISAAAHLFNRDILGLNVLLSNLITSEHFNAASVYDNDKNLLAQVGKKVAKVGSQKQPDPTFTQQITFQNVSVGYVQISFDQRASQQQLHITLYYSLIIHVLLIISIGLLGWFYGDLFYIWTLQAGAKSPRQIDRQSSANESQAITTNKNPIKKDPVASVINAGTTTIMRIKVSPRRLLPSYLEQLKQACMLHSGQLETTLPEIKQGKDILVCFRQTDQLLQASCAGLLLLEIFSKSNSKATVAIGIHWVLDQKDKIHFEQATKHASYLASISQNQLLISRAVHDHINLLEQYDSQAFHSSLVRDGEVYWLKTLNNAELIRNQAKTLGQNVLGNDSRH
ncbi:MAG: hypothetical protein KUG79_01140 [Pseudomonadales bacterium]|nr:hypothetical protein [Pseudomonadales bacterium]